MGYAAFSYKSFSSRLCCREGAGGTASPRFGMAKERIAHGASLVQFLIFCKKLPARAIPFLAASIKKQLALGRVSSLYVWRRVEQTPI
jgi:hypothetical protein